MAPETARPPRRVASFLPVAVAVFAGWQTLAVLPVSFFYSSAATRFR